MEKLVCGHGSASIASSQHDMGLRIYLNGVFACVQRLRNEALTHRGVAGTSAGEHLGRLQIMGALSLYLAFINLFQIILSRFGQCQRG